MIRSLVGIPTVSRDSNLKLIEFVSDYLRPHGAEVRLTNPCTLCSACPAPILDIWART